MISHEMLVWGISGYLFLYGFLRMAQVVFLGHQFDNTKLSLYCLSAIAAIAVAIVLLN